VPIKTSAGPLLERKGDLTAILTSLETKKYFSGRNSSLATSRGKKCSTRRWKISR
jgi:hypothetical protein